MATRITLILILTISLLPYFALSSQRLCVQIEENGFVEPSPGPQGPAQRIYGAPGKMGPKGEIGSPGARGPKGPPGNVDYDKIHLDVEEKINSAIHKVRSELKQEMKEIEDELRLENRFLRAKIDGFCDVEHNDICYWVYFGSKEMDIDQATALCEGKQSVIADVIDEKHYELLLEKIRTKFTKKVTTIDVWVGMKFDEEENKVTSRTGTGTAYVNWFPKHPSDDSNYINMLIRVKKESDRKQGMINRPHSSAFSNVICKFTGI